MNQHSEGKTALLQPGKKALKMKEHESKIKTWLLNLPVWMEEVLYLVALNL